MSQPEISDASAQGPAIAARSATIAQAAAASATAGAQGLSSAEVEERIRAGHTNAYKEQTSRSVGQILRANVFTFFNGILAVMLVLVLIFGSPVDALFGFVLILNTATGTIAEVRAKRALDRLTVLEAPRALVFRDGTEREIRAADVVLGDVLRLRSGEQIPADAEVLSTEGLEVDESILTGESDAVRPLPGDRVMSGTTITAGTALVRTTAVGAQAYANRLAAEARKYSLVVSELQQGTNRILKWISWVIVPVGLLLVWSQLRLLGEEGGLTTAMWSAAIVAGVAGVVGMVPQGLVLLTSVNFATASLTLARRNVLVQELPSVEVLARVDTLCLDKTGTLTTGRITLREVLGANGQIPDDAATGGAQTGGAEAAAGDNTAYSAGGRQVLAVPADLREALVALTAVGDPNATAEAIIESITTQALGEGGSPLDRPEFQAITARLGEQVPFSSARKWSGARLDTTSWVLGAPEILLSGAVGGPQLLQRVSEIAGGGVRVVAIARSEQSFRTGASGEHLLPAELEAAGLVVLTEQVRPDAPQTLEYFREQGVEVLIVSGDNPETVAAVAARAGVRGPSGEPGSTPVFVDARSLPITADTQADRQALADELDGVQVLGRVTPEQKKAVVQALHFKGRTVAMTGDGVNDALALKEADLGIAMGNGAPATKAVARMVLLSGEFSALPGVVAEGRRVMANTERIASLFLAKTVYASLIAVIVSLTAISYPFLPRQLTIVSSLTIGVPAFILALAPNSQRYRAGFLPRVLAVAVPAGLVAGVATLATQQWLQYAGAEEAQVTTGATLVLVLAGLGLLTLTARPLWSWRLGLIAAMALLAILGVLLEPIRAFFLLAWPEPSTWLAILVGGAVAIGGIQAVGHSSWVARHTAR